MSQLSCNLVCTESCTFSFHISNFDPGVGTILTVFLRIAYNTQVLQLQNLGYLCYYRGKKERHRQTVDREWRPYNFLTAYVNQFMISFDCLLRDYFFEGIGMEGEILVIHNVSRFCDGVYQCVASNDVPPAVEMETKVTVECK